MEPNEGTGVTVTGFTGSSMMARGGVPCLNRDADGSRLGGLGGPGADHALGAAGLLPEAALREAGLLDPALLETALLDPAPAAILEPALLEEEEAFFGERRFEAGFLELVDLVDAFRAETFFFAGLRAAPVFRARAAFRGAAFLFAVPFVFLLRDFAGALFVARFFIAISPPPVRGICAPHYRAHNAAHSTSGIASEGLFRTGR